MNEMNALRGRAHPVMVMENLWRVFYLVIIPVLRGFFTALQGGFATWISGAWLDILILFSMLTIAVLIWRRCVYICDHTRIELKSGLFYARRTVIEWDHVATLSCKMPFFLRPLRVALLRADTIGGSYRDADIRIWLSYADAGRIVGIYRATHPGSDMPVPLRSYSPSLRSVLAFSSLNSNSFGGIVFIATFISQAGRLLGNEVSELLIGTFEDAARTLALGVPPAAAAIAYALLTGWVIGFMLTVFRYVRLSITMGDGKLMIKSGYFTNRSYVLNPSRINFIDIRQTVVTKCLGFQTLFISAVGYGKHKDDISCVLTTARPDTLRAGYERFFPGFVPTERSITPCRDGIFAYLYPSVYYLLCLVVLTAFFLTVFPSWGTFILFVLLMLLVPGLLFFLVRYIDFKTSGISHESGCFTLRYSFGFQLHTVVIPEEKIVKISVRQSLLQRARGNCDVTLYTPAEHRNAHKCRNLKLHETLALLLQSAK